MLIIKDIDLFINTDIDFTDYDIVRNLIFNRQEIMTLALYQQENTFMSYRVENRNYDLLETIEWIYGVLDNYIDLCNLNDFNKDIIDLLFRGLTVKEISIIKNASDRTIFNRLRRIVLKINTVAENGG